MEVAALAARVIKIEIPVEWEDSHRIKHDTVVYDVGNGLDRDGTNERVLPLETPIMQPEVSESELALYERMSDAMIPLVQRHLVSIAAYYERELHHHATGALVRFGDHHFLVTAAHAIEDFHKAKEAYSDISLFVDNGHSNGLVLLEGHYHATQIVRDRQGQQIRVSGERNDLWDIGLWELDRRTVDALTTKVFLNRRDISITANLTSGVYFLAGCPRSWAHVDSETRSATWKWIRYTAHPYPEWRELPGFDSRFHMALCLGDDSGLPTKYEGISGCPIWKLSDLPVPADWSVEHAKIVAVQTCVYRRRPLKAIRGTKWHRVVAVLAHMHPEIREAFKIWLPGQE